MNTKAADYHVKTVKYHVFIEAKHKKYYCKKVLLINRTKNALWLLKAIAYFLCTRAFGGRKIPCPIEKYQKTRREIAMNNGKTSKWLKERGIVLEESFVSALRRYAGEYQHAHGIRHLADVYGLLGTSRQNVEYWEKNPCSTQTKNFEISCDIFCCPVV